MRFAIFMKLASGAGCQRSASLPRETSFLNAQWCMLGMIACTSLRAWRTADLLCFTMPALNSAYRNPILLFHESTLLLEEP